MHSFGAEMHSFGAEMHSFGAEMHSFGAECFVTICRFMLYALSVL
jgi:hypothetical protein